MKKQEKTDNIVNSKKSENKVNTKRKIDNKKIIVFCILLVIITYVFYTIYLLIKQPTNIFTVEEGKL